MKRKDDTTKLYSEIFKNAAMGAGTTKHLLDSNRGGKMNESLQKQYAEYRAICRNAAASAYAHGSKIKGLSRMEKMRTDSAVSFNLLFNNSDSHVAEMLMNGSTMGVINAQKKLKKYKNADSNAQALMQHLSDFETRTIDEMKSYL